MPMRMPEEIAAATETVSSAPATECDRPCASVRYGTPHIRANVVTENCVPMWVKKPSRVPGRSHTAFRCGHVSRTRIECRRHCPAVRGVADHRQHQATASTPRAADERYAVLQPAPPSSATNGIADSTWPNWPQMPVN